MGIKKKNIKGLKFSRWLVIDFTYIANGVAMWLCRCECGIERIVSGVALRRGKSKSCGCLQRESVSTHNMTKDCLFQTWNNMIQRCCNKKNHAYNRYGGAGRIVFKAWISDFVRFKNDIEKEIGKRPSKSYSLDRINNNMGYEPGNLKWSTMTEQANNTRRNRYVTYNGEIFTVAQLSKKLGVKYHVIYNQIKKT